MYSTVVLHSGECNNNPRIESLNTEKRPRRVKRGPHPERPSKEESRGLERRPKIL